MRANNYQSIKQKLEKLNLKRPDISCLICKTPLKSSNLNKHYKKVHGIDIQIQELEISGVGELNQEGFISHWSLPGPGSRHLSHLVNVYEVVNL